MVFSGEKDILGVVKKLYGPSRNKSAIAYEVFSKLVISNISEIDKARLRRNFIDAVEASGNDSMLNDTIGYAIHLSEYPGDLLYEEMHKLFSLSDEIESMILLGLKISTDLRDKLMAAVRSRIKSDSKKARLVAEDRFEKWKAEWYHYVISME
jgi:hypothetical protein